MTNTTNVSVELDNAVKLKADAMASTMGMTLSAAISYIVSQMVSDKAVPLRAPISAERAAEFHQLIDSIRAKNEKVGFMTDEEIDAEIQAYRSERRACKG